MTSSSYTQEQRIAELERRIVDLQRLVPQHIAHVVLDEKGIAEALGISVSFVRKDRGGKRILPFFRIGDLIRYDLGRVRAALLANEEGGRQKATRRRSAEKQ